MPSTVAGYGARRIRVSSCQAFSSGVLASSEVPRTRAWKLQPSALPSSVTNPGPPVPVMSTAWSGMSGV